MAKLTLQQLITMGISQEKSKAILEEQDRTGRRYRVTLNKRLTKSEIAELSKAVSKFGVEFVKLVEYQPTPRRPKRKKA